MTECNGCGRCCNPVVSMYSQMQVATSLKTSDNEDFVFHPENRRWFLQDLIPMKRKDGLPMVSDYMEGVQVLQYMDNRTGKIRDDLEERHLLRFYKCKNYDEETRECAIYDTRPPLCKNYPWYEGYVDPVKTLPPECSYNADIGKPVKFLERAPRK